jgi:hypothetical protein
MGLTICRGKRVTQAVFNTMFTMDLWYDMTTAIHVAFTGHGSPGFVATMILYSIVGPLDMFNLFIRTGYCLEDIPARSHLLNLTFEVPMLLFNIYVLKTCALSYQLLWCVMYCKEEMQRSLAA